ncbi:hypothetical protein ABBQ38_010860 [Trebouxia sp. C0009 RCD-2024]
MPGLNGTTVICTGFPDQTRQLLQRLVVDLGGSYLTDCSTGVRPDVMVACSVLSSKYKAIVAQQPNVPIVKAEWLHACRKENSKVPTQQYQLRAFEGLEICISGYVKRKVDMGAFIGKHGGHYNAELNKATCHVLVCEVPSGQKYKVARVWGKAIVTDKWLQASAISGHCKDTAAYDLKPASGVDLPQSRVPSGPAPVLASDFRHSRSASQSVPQQTTQVNPAEPLCQSAPTADTHGQQPRECTAVAPLPQANRPAAAPVAPAQQPKQDTNSSAKASIIEAPTATGTLKDGHKTHQASAAPRPVQLPNPTPASRLDDQDCLFLGGVQLHLCCCNPEEQLQLVRIAREGCALRYAGLSSGLTHIVVGSDPTAAEVQAVKEYVQEHRSGVKVVRADWLRQCGEERSLLPASSDYIMPLSSLTAPPARLVPLSPDKQEAQRVQAGVSGGGQGADNGVLQAGQKAAGGGEEGDECEAAVGSQAPKHQALKGLWFTLAAIENSDKHEAQRAQALVRRYGGRRFTSQTLHLLQGVDKANVLALCPCSLPKHKVMQLQCWGDFTSVPEKHRVSMLWLEWVIQSGRIIDFQHRGSVACRPFPFALPLPGMSDIRVTVSSYPEDVKISISHLVTILGGKYTTSLGRRNSHLLIRAAAGPKFAGCMSRQVIPVVADWLIESAYAGRLLDERDFHPPALPDGDSDAGFSQMPLDTQMPTQAGTQANLLTRFGAVDVPPRRGPAGGSQGPPRPMSLLQKVAQDAKRRTLTASQGGMSLARELSQAHGNAPAGALQAAKPPVPSEPLRARSTGSCLLDTILEGAEPGSSHRSNIGAGLTTFEGIANTLKRATDAAATPLSSGHPQGGEASSAQHPNPAGKSRAGGDRQADGTLESALSRLGGMLESAGPLMDQPCSQLEVPAEAPARGSGGGWPQSTNSSGNASFPSGRASRPKDTSGLFPVAALDVHKAVE